MNVWKLHHASVNPDHVSFRFVTSPLSSIRYSLVSLVSRPVELSHLTLLNKKNGAHDIK